MKKSLLKKIRLKAFTLILSQINLNFKEGTESNYCQTVIHLL